MEDQCNKIGGDVMTAKEKAKELVSKFIDEIPPNQGESIKEFIKIDIESSKRCALIAIDEILKSNPYKDVPFLDYEDCTVLKSNIKYWQEVKSEIEKL